MTKKSCGVLLHITALPGNYGIGDFGPEARIFVDSLASAKVRYWQILPIFATSEHQSPYSAVSTYAGNTLLISLDDLVSVGLLDSEIANSAQCTNSGWVEFDSIVPQRDHILDWVATHFHERASQRLLIEYNEFISNNDGSWLHDCALYQVIKNSHHDLPWFEWPQPLRARNNVLLEQVAHDNALQIEHFKIKQFLFFLQWHDLKDYANNARVQILGDIPIFIHHDSVDAWRDQDLFHFDSEGKCTVIAGVPPDYFSETGQRWGNPLYRWDKMAEQNFTWWHRRLDHMLNCFNLLRIDHFRGFESYWEIPVHEPTAINGRWVKSPGLQLFESYRKSHSSDSNNNEATTSSDILKRMVVEDLGIITKEVELLRDHFGFPGTRVLEFAFDGEPDNPHLPQNYIDNCIAYTSTHDNNTLQGWLDHEVALEQVARQLNLNHDEINTDKLLECVFHSTAKFAIVPVQDVLGLDSSTRFNVPGKAENNWRWRLSIDLWLKWQQQAQSKLQALAIASARATSL